MLDPARADLDDLRPFDGRVGLLRTGSRSVQAWLGFAFGCGDGV
jgi:hypothetical protein